MKAAPAEPSWRSSGSAGKRLDPPALMTRIVKHVVGSGNVG